MVDVEAYASAVDAPGRSDGGGKPSSPAIDVRWLVGALVATLLVVGVVAWRRGRDQPSAAERAQREAEAERIYDDITSDLDPEPEAITLDEFGQITTGMSYDEVVDVVGGPGELQSQTDLGGVHTVAYMWNGVAPYDGVAGDAIVIFQNGEVIPKSQFGLR